MSEIADSVNGEALTGRDTGAVELRIFRVMIASIAVAVIAGAILAPWRVTTGLMLGGGLALLNYHWLRTSVAAIFAGDIKTRRPRVRALRYLIRYFVVGAVAFAAYKVQIVSLPAMFAGLCSFVPAMFVEAGRQFYLVIIRREDSY
jgi:hypothetical protein